MIDGVVDGYQMSRRTFLILVIIASVLVSFSAAPVLAQDDAGGADDANGGEAAQ